VNASGRPLKPLPLEGKEYHPPWDQRGEDLGRFLSLSDGVFGFALTLLVLNLVLPIYGSTSAAVPFAQLLGNARFQQELIAYALGFLIIGNYWRSHHALFAYFRRWNRAVLQLGLLVLGFVALQPFLVTVVEDYGGTVDGTVFFAAVSTLTGLSLWAVWEYGARHRYLLCAEIDPEGIAFMRRILLTTPAWFAATIPVALVAPSIALYLWFGVFFLQLVHFRRARRGSRAASPPAPP
jgi:uncharacterized membrane protein